MSRFVTTNCGQISAWVHAKMDEERNLRRNQPLHFTKTMPLRVYNGPTLSTSPVNFASGCLMTASTYSAATSAFKRTLTQEGQSTSRHGSCSEMAQDTAPMRTT